ncbi:MAG: hypothetical protein M3132_03180 [Actinomycetia bacterium]|nr:hypothetical protein [Actinomycetes bacterium]
MTRKRKFGAVGVLATMIMLSVGVLASPAGAVVDGPCTGFAFFSTEAGGPTVAEIDATQSLSIVTVVPDKASVDYIGAIDMPEPSDPVSFVGGISANVAGVGSINMFDWNGETVEIFAEGNETYDVPGWVPRGTGEILVTATHQQGGTTCVAEVNVTLDGSPGAAAIIAATGTLVFGAGTIGAGFKRKVVA